MAAALGTCEEPRLPAKSHISQRSLGRVVGEANAAVFEEASEHRLGVWGVPGEPGALCGHPDVEVGDERRDLGPPGRQPLIGGQTVDGALEMEDGVDPLPSSASGEIGVAFFPRRALAAMSATSKHFRRA